MLSAFDSMMQDGEVSKVIFSGFLASLQPKAGTRDTEGELELEKTERDTESIIQINYKLLIMRNCNCNV